MTPQRHRLSDETINDHARWAYYTYHRAMGNGTPTLWEPLSDDSPSSITLTDAEKAPWIAVAHTLGEATSTLVVELGSTATMFASQDFPSTRVKLLSQREVSLATIELPDGTTP